MADYQIDPNPSGLRIAVTGIEGKQVEFLKSVQECKEGRCSCPSQEYDKLASIEATASHDGVEIALRTKAGAELDAASIASCVDHTLRQLDVRRDTEGAA